jgi:hypothetical protein
MPEISRFLGVVIYMYYNDHGPPHVHARYGNFEARFDIRTSEILSGDIPLRARQHVLEWIELHRRELTSLWHLAQERKPLPRIEPLE